MHIVLASGMLLAAYLVSPPKEPSFSLEEGLESAPGKGPLCLAGGSPEVVADSSNDLCVTEFVVKDFETWYDPENASPGDMISFHAGEDAPSRPDVHWAYFSTTTERAGAPSSPIWFPIRSLDEPSVGMYQVSALQGPIWVISRFKPINIPSRRNVTDSGLLSLRAEEIGEWNFPPFATIVIRGDEKLTWVHTASMYYRRDGISGGSSGDPEDMVWRGGEWIFPGENSNIIPGPAPEGALVYVWACGVDQDGVVHFSPTLNFTIGQSWLLPSVTLAFVIALGCHRVPGRVGDGSLPVGCR